MDPAGIHQILRAGPGAHVEVVPLRVRDGSPLKGLGLAHIDGAVGGIDERRRKRRGDTGSRRKSTVPVLPDTANRGPDARVQRSTRRETCCQIRRRVEAAGIDQIRSTRCRADVEVIPLRIRHARPRDRLRHVRGHRAVGGIREPRYHGHGGRERRVDVAPDVVDSRPQSHVDRLARRKRRGSKRGDVQPLAVDQIFCAWGGPDVEVVPLRVGDGGPLKRQGHVRVDRPVGGVGQRGRQSLGVSGPRPEQGGDDQSAGDPEGGHG